MFNVTRAELYKCINHLLISVNGCTPFLCLVLSHNTIDAFCFVYFRLIVYFRFLFFVAKRDTPNERLEIRVRYVPGLADRLEPLRMRCKTERTFEQRKSGRQYTRCIGAMNSSSDSRFEKNTRFRVAIKNTHVCTAVFSLLNFGITVETNASCLKK